jgi:drug/metabolite transporter (DMT)-like permease
MTARPLRDTPASALSPNTLGALYMVIGSLGYVVNDALIRAATEDGLDVYQALCLRGIAMTVLFAGISRVRGERIAREQLTRPLLTRVAAELVATALFFGALVQLDFANAQTILLIVPFAVTLVAALVLGEAVTARHYAAVVAGFLGVLLVVQPATDGFSLWSIAVVGSAAGMTVREFATRQVPSTVPASSIALVTAGALTVLTGIIAIFTGWNAITLQAALLVVLACLCLVVGYMFTIQTVRVGDLSVSAPFRYTTLIGAVVLGYLFFDEIPNALTIIGCSIILVAGMYAISMERRAVAAAKLATLDRTGL